MSNTVDDDARYLNVAIQTAYENVLHDGGPFGAVVVTADGQVFSAANRVTENNDPTAHAEVNVIRKACAELGTFSLEGAVLYSSCEPCPMCLGACLWARVDRVVYAADRFDAADAGFDDAAFYEKLAEGNVAKPFVAVEKLLPFTTWKNNTSRTEY